MDGVGKMGESIMSNWERLRETSDGPGTQESVKVLTGALFVGVGAAFAGVTPVWPDPNRAWGG